MKINNNMRIWAEKNTICIQVNPNYTYWAKIQEIGKEDDPIGFPSLYGWIKHLKEKVWWNQEIQKSFIELGEIIFSNKQNG